MECGAAERNDDCSDARLILKDGRAKIEIALARGKKLHDKRETIAKRDAEREAKQEAHHRE